MPTRSSGLITVSVCIPKGAVSSTSKVTERGVAVAERLLIFMPLPRFTSASGWILGPGIAKVTLLSPCLTSLVCVISIITFPFSQPLQKGAVETTMRRHSQLSIQLIEPSASISTWASTTQGLSGQSRQAGFPPLMRSSILGGLSS